MATPMLAGLLKVAASDPKLKGLATQVGEPHLHITGIDQARPWAIGTLANQAPVLVVTATGREAEDLTAELTAMMGDKVAQFPAWETLPARTPFARCGYRGPPRAGAAPHCRRQAARRRHGSAWI